jgi:excisionase family DNA binding protein
LSDEYRASSIELAYGTYHIEDIHLLGVKSKIEAIVLNCLCFKADLECDENSLNNGDEKMAKGKNVLTTGDVAKICNVAPRTVSKWFDTGQLKGYRIPGSKDRRIPLSELIRFMKAHNMPTAGLPVGKIRVLVVDSNEETSLVLAEALENKAGYEVQTVKSNFETGATAQKFAPHVLLVNLLAEGIDAAAICRSIRTNEDLQTIKVIALANSLNDSESAALLKKGFDGYISDSSDVTQVIKRIEEAIAIIY